MKIPNAPVKNLENKQSRANAIADFSTNYREGYMNIQKNKRASIVLLVIVIITLIYGALTQNVRALTIEECQTKIETNNAKIQNLEEIKNQLHITAQLLRENDYINNSLDKALSEKWHECNDLQLNKQTENKVLENKLHILQSEQNRKQFVGVFKITHYCPCATCNGSYGSKTASGTRLTPCRTIAVDPKIIPIGSKVEIQGKIYIAEDTGGAIKGNRIDLCVSSHSEAYRNGVLYNVPVYIIR